MRKLLGAATAALFIVAPVSAATFTGLYNTGVDDLGAQLAANDAIELHYGTKLRTQPVTYSNPAYATVTDARFIAAQSGGGTPRNATSVMYALAFDVDGDLTGARLDGLFAADNGGTIALNGVDMFTLAGDPVSNFNQLHAFSITSGFVTGQNILRFIITDTGNPSAFAVSGLTGTTATAAVPETATWAMMVGGFGLVGAGLRRRKTAIAFA